MRRNRTAHTRLNLVAALGLVLGLLAPMFTFAAPRAAAADTCRGATERTIRFASGSNTVYLEGCRQSFTLSDILTRFPDRSKVQRVDRRNKVWYAKVNIRVTEGARLNLLGDVNGRGGEVNWLKLRSEDKAAVSLRTINGEISIKNTKVTSWDPTKPNGGGVDTNVTPVTETDPTGATVTYPGRAFVAARSEWDGRRPTTRPTACAVNGGTDDYYEARMDIASSELAYLGYDASEAYGVSYKVVRKAAPANPAARDAQLANAVDVFGDIAGSRLHHNYDGVYTSGSYCQNITGSTFESNLKHGLEARDDSDSMRVLSSVFQRNAANGIVNSEFGSRFVVRGNRVLRNDHGILLQAQTNRALVERNSISLNRDSGIVLYDAYASIVRRNIVSGNADAAVRLTVAASRNSIADNTLTGGRTRLGNGFVVYGTPGTAKPILGGTNELNRNTFLRNRMTGFKSPVVKMGTGSLNSFIRNTVIGPQVGFRFSGGFGNVVASTRFGAGITTEVSTSGAAGAVASVIVRNPEVGEKLHLAQNSFASNLLQDTGNHVWLVEQSGLSTTARVRVTELSLTTKSSGPSKTVTTLDFTVRPRKGNVSVTPTTWQTSGTRAKEWTEDSAVATGAVRHAVGNLESGTCYAARVNGKLIVRAKANRAGRIVFSYTGGYSGTKTFTVKEGSGCS